MHDCISCASACVRVCVCVCVCVRESERKSERKREREREREALCVVWGDVRIRTLETLGHEVPVEAFLELLTALVKRYQES